VIAALLALLQQGPDSHYAGGASSRTAGTTALAGHLFRFLFSTVPQWVQLAGILIGVPVAVIVIWQLWKRRRPIWAWWLTKSVAFRAAMLGALFLLASAGLGSALYGYNYVMHENDFCQACHVMDAPWNRFQVSAHKNIQCHGCHRQPLYVSTKELFWWVVERRMSVPPHDKVPTAVCSECHMRRGTDSARTLVTLTAGHALHLQSDSSALAKVECVTCHGRDFHQFKPTSTSCAQSGCHMNLPVNLGAMSRQGFMHCTSCHDFKGLVPPGTTAQQAKLALVPRSMDCFSCHTMTEEIRRFDLAADKHKGNCGMCHNVHKQTTPADAYKSCATAQCHANADTLTAFHRGLGPHSLDRCSACHQAHSWKVKGTNCVACHQGINQDRPRAQRSASLPRPSAIRRIARHRAPSQPVVRLAGFALGATPVRADATPARPSRLAAILVPALDTTFTHSRHKSLSCTTCHSVTSTHGGLKFTRPAGCYACHHGPTQRTPCVKCHTKLSVDQRTMPMPFAISARRDVVTRPVPFAHERHETLACTRCHGPGNDRPVTAKCSDCHTEHHVAAADCATCHTTARAGHDRASHEGCAGCHTDATVAALPVSREVCLTCHQAQRAHYPAGDCATCHALANHGMMSAGGRSASR
jgi:Formate hydrogenlyase subunit 3/Multisubunit Na+/H+ antiporter, MnhD subunit